MNKISWALPFLMLTSCPDYNLSALDDPEHPDGSDPAPGGVDGSDTPWPSDTPLGGLHGKICHDFEEGLEGIEVLIEHAYGVARTFTDADGNYALNDIPAGEYMLVAVGAEYFFHAPVLVPANELIEIQHPECVTECDIPVPCVGLAEAFDRGAASVSFQAAMGVGSVVVTNESSDLEICLDPWMVAFSPDSQDVLFGPRDGHLLPPGQSIDFPYRRDVFGGDGQRAWWCVEQYQYTRAGSYYTYNGSLAPSRLMGLVVDRTDLNSSGILDQIDIVDGQAQTQHNIWDTERAHPIFLVGRRSSLVQLTGPGQRRPVEVEVRNLGQRSGTTSVVEVVPPGFNVTDVNPPGQVSTLADGSTRIAWDVSLDGAEPDFNYVLPTRYDDAVLRYSLSLGDEPCEGRCEGNGLLAEWNDRMGRSWSSASEPLIIEHCVPEVRR